MKVRMNATSIYYATLSTPSRPMVCSAICADLRASVAEIGVSQMPDTRGNACILHQTNLPISDGRQTVG